MVISEHLLYRWIARRASQKKSVRTVPRVNEEGCRMRPPLRSLVLNWLRVRGNRRRRTLAEMRERAERQQRGRRFHVRPLYQARKTAGAYHILMPKLRDDDEMFINYFRMTQKAFDKLALRLWPKLQKHTNRESISPGERVALTVRYILKVF